MANSSHPVREERRPLRLRMRPDLVIQEHCYRGQRYWTIKDPLQLRYYRFEDEEYFLLQQLDGQITSGELQRAFAARFAPQQISLDEIQRLVSLLFRSNLLLSEAPGQGEQLNRRRSDQRWQRWKNTLANPLSIRVPLCHPAPFLRWLNDQFSWFYSWWALLLQLFLVISALGLVTAEYHEVSRRLPHLQTFFGPANWIYLAVVLGATKVLHELGHGFACHRFGGDCHEMGVLWLIFTPCLYCDVSDSWILPNKWHRAIIGAAGMHVEIVLAASATWIWWFTQDGLIHHLSLVVMTVCSISTLAFNANPLMRYDGYYILCDLLEVPNLRQKASETAWGWWTTRILGISATEQPEEPLRRRAWFLAYALASLVYSGVLFVGIIWVMCLTLEPYGLQVVGQMFAILLVAGTAVSCGKRLLRALEQETTMKSGQRTFARWRLVVSLAVLAMLLFIPLPHRIRCDIYLDVRDAAPVYVDVPGQLQQARPAANNPVRAGEFLCKLENVDLEVQRQDLLGQQAQAQARLAHLRHAAYADPSALAEISQVEENLATLAERLKQLESDLNRLTICAPRDGVFVPPRDVANDPNAEGRLGFWSGLPLEARNVGAYLDEGTLLGRVATPGQFVAIATLDQHQVPFVHPNQRVDFIWDQYRSRCYTSSLAQVARREVTRGSNARPPFPQHALVRPTSTVPDGPSPTRFEASVPFDEPLPGLVVGGRGEARIHAGYRSLAARLRDLLFRTFSSGNG